MRRILSGKSLYALAGGVFVVKTIHHVSNYNTSVENGSRIRTILKPFVFNHALCDNGMQRTIKLHKPSYCDTYGDFAILWTYLRYLGGASKLSNEYLRDLDLELQQFPAKYPHCTAAGVKIEKPDEELAKNALDAKLTVLSKQHEAIHKALTEPFASFSLFQRANIIYNEAITLDYDERPTLTQEYVDGILNEMFKKQMEMAFSLVRLRVDASIEKYADKQIIQEEIQKALNRLQQR